MADIFEKNIVAPSPSVHASRNTFDLSRSYKTGVTSGLIYPFFMQEVLPGDVFTVDTAFVMRMLTPVCPVMDNAYIDYSFFFVPNRISMNKLGVDDKTWQKVMGENTTSYWADNNKTSVPSVSLLDIRVYAANHHGSDPWNQKTFDMILRNSLYGYFGLPSFSFDGGVFSADEASKIRISLAPFYAYQTIFNRRWRDENLQNPKYLDGAELVLSNPFPSCKLHDLFTDALPAPQFGDSVYLNLLTGLAPVHAMAEAHDSGYPGTDITHDEGIMFYNKETMTPISNAFDFRVNSDGYSGFEHTQGTPSDGLSGSPAAPVNLAANLGEAIGATPLDVNNVRYSIALQSLREVQARFGNRYAEILKGQYGTSPAFGVIDDPEYLGGKRVPINIDTVLQTSGTTLSGDTATGALGDTGAFSNTFDSSGSFTKGFDDFGYIIGVFTIRTHQSYFQGIDKSWRHLDKLDFWNSQFDHIGEQPIKQTELFVGPGCEDHVFGYQEAWYEYRAHHDTITGALSPVYGDENLKHWTYANAFSQAPTLSDSFIVQSPNNVGDTLVDTSTPTQFLCDFHFSVKAARNMSLTSRPASLLRG